MTARNVYELLPLVGRHRFRDAYEGQLCDHALSIRGSSGGPSAFWTGPDGPPWLGDFRVDVSMLIRQPESQRLASAGPGAVFEQLAKLASSVAGRGFVQTGVDRNCCAWAGDRVAVNTLSPYTAAMADSAFRREKFEVEYVDLGVAW